MKPIIRQPDQVLSWPIDKAEKHGSPSSLPTVPHSSVVQRDRRAEIRNQVPSETKCLHGFRYCALTEIPLHGVGSPLIRVLGGPAGSGTGRHLDTGGRPGPSSLAVTVTTRHPASRRGGPVTQQTTRLISYCGISYTPGARRWARLPPRRARNAGGPMATDRVESAAPPSVHPKK
jgi:hypothetical protein